MPLDENDLKVIEEKISKAQAPVTELATKFEQLNKDLPGLTARKVQEATKPILDSLEALKPKPTETKQPDDKGNADKETKERLKALEEENARWKQEKEDAKVEAEIERALSQHPVVQDAADLTRNYFRGQVKKGEDGSFYINSKKKIGDKEFDDPVPISEGVKRYLEARPALRAAAVKGGSGAGGSAGGNKGGASAFDGIQTFGELLKNPAKAHAAYAEDPERYRKMQVESLAKK